MESTGINKEGLIQQLQDLQQKVKEQRESILFLEERFKKLSEAQFEAILIHEDGNIIEMNDACIKMFGYTREELLKMKSFDLAIPDQRKRSMERVRNRVMHIEEYTGLRKNGKSFYLEAQTRETTYGDRVVRVVAIRDITDRKNDEKKLQQSKEDYEALVKYSPDGIFIHNEKGEIIFANPSALRIAEIQTLKQALGKSIFDFILPEHHTTIKEQGTLLKQGQDLPFKKIRIKRMKSAPILIEYKPVLVKYQGKEAILNVYHDITVQEKLAKEQLRVRLAEETNVMLKKEIGKSEQFAKELRSSEEKYKTQSAKLNAIIESSSHMFWTMNNKTDVISFNENFEKLIKSIYGSKPKRGTNLSKGEFISSKENNKFWIKKTKEAFSGKPQYFEASLRGKKDQLVWLEVHLNPIYNEKRIITEISGVAHDITEKKQSEEKVKKSLEEKEILLKEIHHRVKNNLQVISSILNLQSTYVKDAKTLEILKESQNRIKSMSFIHESLYRNEDFSNINFQDYVQNLTNNLLISYSNASKKITLKQKINNVFLNLDIAIPLGLIINELMSNSLKYAFENKNKGQLEISMESAGRSQLKMVIKDNGVGLPEHINFKKTESLGLQLVNILVDQLDGAIKLENNKGAKFTLTFNKKKLKL